MRKRTLLMHGLDFAISAQVRQHAVAHSDIAQGNDPARGLDLTAQLGASGTPELSAAEQGLTTELASGPGANPGFSDLAPFSSGALLSAGNPYFQGAFNTAANAVTPGTLAPFIGAGRYGSGASDAAEASALTNAATGLAFKNYDTMAPLSEAAGASAGNLWNTGNSNINFGSSVAPGLTNQNFTDLTNLINAGAANQGQQQSYINSDVNRFGFNQQSPWSTAANFANLIGAPQPGGGTTQTPFFTNPLGSALGAASGITGIGNSLFGSNGLWPGALNGPGKGAGALAAAPTAAEVSAGAAGSAAGVSGFGLAPLIAGGGGAGAAGGIGAALGAGGGAVADLAPLLLL